MKSIFTNKFFVKLIIGILVLTIVFSFTGCSKKKKAFDEMSEDELIEYFEDYYDNYDDGDDEDYSEAYGGGATAGQTIDLGAAITVTPSGYNGNGSVSVNVDKDILDSLISKETMENYFELIGWSEPIRFMSNLINFKEEVLTAPLSNGSTYTINVELSSNLDGIEESMETFQQRLGVNFNTTLTYQITGLKEGICLDIFPYIEQYISGTVSDGYVTIEGGNGKGNADINIPNDLSFEIQGYYFSSQFYNSLSVVKDNQEVCSISLSLKVLTKQDKSDVYDTRKLSNGDCVALIANYDNESFTDSVFIPSFKSYKISGLGDFVDSYSQIPQSEVQRVKTEVMNMVSDKHSTYTYETFYYGEAKPTTIVDNTSKTILIVVVKGSHIAGNGYQSYGVYDLSLKDGKLSYDFDEYYGHFLYGDTIEAGMTAAYSDYDLTEINI